MTVLIMDEALKARAKEIAEYASRPENLFKPPESDWVPGDRPEFVLESGDVRAVFTLSRGESGDILRQMSISVPRKGRYPAEIVVYTVASFFGFTGGVTSGPDSDVVTGPGEDWGIFANEVENTLVVLQPVGG